MLTEKEIRVLLKLLENPPNRTRWCYQSLSTATGISRKGIKEMVSKFKNRELLNYPWVETSEDTEQGKKIVFVEFTDEGEMLATLLKSGFEPGFWY